MRCQYSRSMTGRGNQATRALGRCLGSGKDADVFELDDDVIKLFKSGVPKHTAFREAASLAQAEAFGLPVPCVREVRLIDERWGVTMSRADGPCFADAMLASPAQRPAYLKTMAVLHDRIHGCRASFFGSLKSKLAANIEHAPALADRRRQDLLDELDALPDGDRLCHGDFHPWNVLGPIHRPVAIDWTSAAKGSPAADVCRSYVLVRPVAPELARSYIETYAQVTGQRIEGILEWLRVVAAARLAEGVDNEIDGLLSMLGDGRAQAGTQ